MDMNKMMGCLFGGAIGDALGYPVEFLTYEKICRVYGRDGIKDYALSEGKALMSDDTQMTLFTLGGLLAWDRENRKQSLNNQRDSQTKKNSWKEYVWNAYQDWLFTQEPYQCPNPPRICWLIEEPVMQGIRAPGNTCLSALEGGICGSMRHPVNNSKGCGGLMRTAPAAFWQDWEYAESDRPAGAVIAAMTHGHPLGFIPAAAFVNIIRVCGNSKGLRYDIEHAIDDTAGQFRDWEEIAEFRKLMDKAIYLADESMPDSEAIGKLGEGWTAEEALAIAVYCSLKHTDNFEAAVAAAVNHSGDSDSTGSITGNIMGAYCGFSNLPRKYLDPLEAKEVIEQLALELARAKGRVNVWGMLREGRKFPEHLMKRAMGLNGAFDLKEDCGNFIFLYLLLYRQDTESGSPCRIRVGPRRFITLSHVAEDSLEIALYIKQKGREPVWHLEHPPIQKKENQLNFDAEKYLKDSDIDCLPVDKERYYWYAYEFRAYTNGAHNHVSRIFASKGGLFYWTSDWADCWCDNVHIFYAKDPGNGDYCQTEWFGGNTGRDFNAEVQLETELALLSQLGFRCD